MFSENTYGARRMQQSLNTLIFPANRRKIAQLMKRQTFGKVTGEIYINDK